MTPTLVIHFLHNRPQLTEDFPELTNSQDPYRDFVYFANEIYRSKVNTKNQVWLLPSETLNPATLAGAAIAAVYGDSSRNILLNHVDIGLIRNLQGMPVFSPYYTRPSTQHIAHKHLLMQVANKICQFILNYPMHEHIIVESIPGGTITATVRAARRGITINPDLTSLHVDEPEYPKRQEMVKEFTDQPQFDHKDDFAEIVGAVCKTMHVFDIQAPIILSGGLMACSAISPVYNNQAIHSRTSICRNPTYFTEMEDDPAIQLKTTQYITKPNPMGYTYMANILDRYPITKKYLQGYVKEGAGLGYGLTLLSRALTGKRAHSVVSEFTTRLEVIQNAVA